MNIPVRNIWWLMLYASDLGKNLERSLFWKDSDLNIDWPLANNNEKNKIITNDKDAIAPTLKEIEKSGDLF